MRRFLYEKGGWAMLFSANVFLFAYLPIVLLTYYLSPRWLRNPVLFLVSLFFYGWGEPVYVFLMVGDIILNYVCGLWIVRQRRQGKTGRSALIWAVVLNLLLLGYFKYANFFLGMFGIYIGSISLPIGISFYIFQSMSYVIDVYREEVPAQKNPLTFGTYVTLFPQLIAGPIVRYRDVAEQMDHRKETVSKFASGVMLFVVGLSKKILIANAVGNLWNLLQSETGTLAAWVGLLCYTLQIYFDFSGYSDMARGLGRMLGFEFLENFNYPYISKSITEFWRRWHISLSTWFKEYVYIPLGGNRKGLARQILNICIVWLLTGLWHGASWNFVLWGAYYAVFLIAEKAFVLKLLKKTPDVIRHIYTMFIVMIGWALFYFEDITALGAFVVKLFTPARTQCMNLILGYLPFLAVSVFAATPVAVNLLSRKDTALLRYGKIAAAVVAMVLCVAALASNSYNPFIYFRF